MTSREDPSSNKRTTKILIFALSGIGDALMFTPALRLLRQQLPEATIDVLVMYKGAQDIYQRNPNVSHTYYFDFQRKGILRSLRFLWGLRGEYDVSVNVYPSNRREYNLLSFLVGAERRIAARYRHRDALNLGFLNTERIQERDSLHNVETNILQTGLLIGKVGERPSPLEFSLTENDRDIARSSLDDMGIVRDDVVVGFHPGCSTLKNHDKRRWGAEKFAELGRTLISRHGAKILIFGGPDEDDLKEDVRTLIGSPRAFAVRTGDLAGTAALMENSRCFVTNDSSLMHVAAALGLHVVAVIGPTNPNFIRPWGTENTVVRLGLECSPCFYYSPRPLTCTRKDQLYKCLRDITAEQVYSAVRPYLSIPESV